MRKKTFIQIAICSLLCVLCLALAAISQRIAWISLSLFLVLATCIPFFVSFEKKKANAKSLVLLSVMTALSVCGRLVFFAVPHFKPVTAMTMISGAYLGPHFGFMCGAMTALISNFYFGQGIYTPYQMLAWGLIGLFAGIMGKLIQKSLIFAVIFAIVSGLFFSLVMDIWTAVGLSEGFSLSRYLSTVITAIPVTVTYMVSNGVFILLLLRPIGNKLYRVKTKYEI